MCEILFKGIAQIGGCWIEGIYFPQNNVIISYFEEGEYDPDEDLTNCKCVVHRVLPATVGRYTGIDDKNSKKMFEGDKVRVETFNSCCKPIKMTGVIEWSNGAFSVAWDKKEYGRRSLNSLDFDKIEVIGNIHDPWNEKTPCCWLEKFAMQYREELIEFLKKKISDCPCDIKEV